MVMASAADLYADYVSALLEQKRATGRVLRARLKLDEALWNDPVVQGLCVFCLYSGGSHNPGCTR